MKISEKALAATGNQSANAAMNWLVSHVNDMNLDENEMREYALVAVPFGSIEEHLTHFWEDSKDLTGWNDAHNMFPHIMLIPFFQVKKFTIKSIIFNLNHIKVQFSIITKKKYKLFPFQGAHGM